MKTTTETKTTGGRNVYADEIEKFRNWLDGNLRIADRTLRMEGTENRLLGERPHNPNSYDRGVAAVFHAFDKIAESSIGVMSIKQISSALIFGWNKFFEIRDDDGSFKIDTRRGNREFIRKYRGFTLTSPVENAVFYFGENNACEESEKAGTHPIFDRVVRTLFAFMHQTGLLPQFIDYIADYDESQEKEPLFSGVIDTIELVNFTVNSKEYLPPRPDMKAFEEQREAGKSPFSKEAAGSAAIIENPFPAAWNVDSFDYSLSISDREARSYFIEALGREISKALEKPVFNMPASNNGYIFFLTGFRNWLMNDPALHGEEIRNVVSYILGGIELIYNIEVPVSPEARKKIKGNNSYNSLLQYYFNSTPGTGKSVNGNTIMGYQFSNKSLLHPQIIDITALLFFTGALRNLKVFNDAEHPNSEKTSGTELADDRAKGVLKAVEDIGSMFQAVPIVTDTADLRFLDKEKTLIKVYADIVRRCN